MRDERLYTNFDWYVGKEKAATVGELIDILELLPRSMALYEGGYAVEVTPYNLVCIEHPEDDNDE